MGCKYLCLDLYYLSVTYSGNGTGAFLDVLPRDLTIDRIDFRAIDRRHTTLFKEVSLVPYSDRGYFELDQIKPVRHAVGWEKMLFDKFCALVGEKFVDGCVVGLSSGYDSRMMALALKKLGLKPAEYCECLGEEQYFLEVVKHLGIKNYRIYKHDTLLNERLLDFIHDCVHGFDGIVGLHLNPFWTPYQEPVDLFSGCGANTITQCLKDYSNYFSRESGIKPKDRQGVRVMKARRYSYYTQLAKYKYRGSPLRPFDDYRFVREVAKVSNWMSDKRSISKQILDKIAPDLARIPRLSPQDCLYRGYRDLPDWCMKQLQDEYNHTWFGQNRPATVARRVDNDQFWVKYQIAMTCEYLLKQGYNIKF